MARDRPVGSDRRRAMAEFSRTPPADSLMSRLTEEDVLRYRDADGRKCGYVPSGKAYVTYRTMSRESLEYYLYWRGCVRSGTFPEADLGYVILLASEIATVCDNPHRDVKILADLVRRYHHLNRRMIGFVGDACVCMSIIKRTEIPPVLLMNDLDLMRYALMSALGKERADYVPINSVILLAELDCPLQTDGRADAVFNTALSKVDRKIRRFLGIGLRDMLGGTSTVSIPVYSGLSYGGKRRRMILQVPTGFEDSIGGKIIIDIARMVLCTRYRNVGMPDRGNDVIRTTVMACISEYDLGKAPSESMTGFGLDRDEILRSEEDLKAVTEMMRISEEDADTDPKEDVIITVATERDGWDGLAESLSEVMWDYLNAAMNGDTDAYLSSVGFVRTAVEKEINTRAMGAVNDIIVEDGRIIPEYVDDVSEMLGCRRYRNAHL
ncbi:MAG: TerB N-terminal domain-containing protein [Candidatus Methanomethylophilaceae archaeon]